MNLNSYQICCRCVMDTSDVDITFDQRGVCNHCKNYEKKILAEIIPKEQQREALKSLVCQIKAKGVGSKYDCIVGVSGGVDSSYVALIAKDLGLRALLVHLDNGWNSEVAVKNIKNISQSTGFDLFTYVIDWNEFRDVQQSLFQASVVDIELATDHAIKAVLYRVAAKFKTKYLLNGGNVATEAIMPVSWRHTKVDKSNLLDIHKKFGKLKLKSFPTAGVIKQLFYKILLGIKNIKILNYVEFDRDIVIQRLKDELVWQEYGGKHHESVFTRFYQAYILPNKFGIDKRRCHYSNLICGGQLTRQEALVALEKPVYDEKLLSTDLDFVLKKLQFKKCQFDDYIKAPEVSHYQYKSDEQMIERLMLIRRKVWGH